MKKLNKKNNKTQNVVKNFCCECGCAEKLNIPKNTRFENAKELNKVLR